MPLETGTKNPECRVIEMCVYFDTEVQIGAARLRSQAKYLLHLHRRQSLCLYSASE